MGKASAGVAVKQPDPELAGRNVARAVNIRWRELAAKYPAVDLVIPSELLQMARDVRMFQRMGHANYPRELLDEMRDLELIAACLDVDNNELGARKQLHALLADALAEDRVTPTMREVLRVMHRALSVGVVADDAMLTHGGGGKPRMSERNAVIRRYVRAHQAYREMTRSAKPTNAEIHRNAARIWELSVKSVQNICAESTD